jgi:hypothetical protein
LSKNEWEVHGWLQKAIESEEIKGKGTRVVGGGGGKEMATEDVEWDEVT